MNIRNILIPFLILISGVVNAQVQYGGVIRAQDNVGAIGNIKRTTDNLKVADSLLAARIPQLTLVGTGLKVDGSSVVQPVSIASGGFISVVNSSTTNLGISAIFTGTGEDVSAYASIKVSIISSSASAVDGLQMQQSTNNVDWDGLDIYSIPAATNRAFSVPVNAKFFRIVYTNGGTVTTSFRLQVTYHISDKQPSSVRPQDGRSNDNDFVETLSFMMGYNSVTNSWNRVGVANAATGGNENLIDRIKVNASLRMIDNAQSSGSKLIGVTGTAALGLDVNLKSVGITSANLGGNETTLDRLKVNASLRMLDVAQPVGSQLVGATGTQAAGLNVNIKNTSLAVTGPFFQATQPVSLATNTPTLQAGSTTTVTQATAANLNATVVGNGTFATQISTALPAGANTIGAVNIAAAQTLANVTTVGAVTAITNALPAGTNSIGNINDLRASNLAVTITAASGTATILTLPAVAGQFHYITSLDILLYSAATRTGSAVPTVVTSTNLPGAVAFTFSTAGAIGTTDTQDLLLTTPLKSATVNTATTIVCPIAASGIWRVTATYFTAP